ncbi:probable WRKY transcription factor 67 isoform X2 [Brassica rapa]|uniref:probable WRKY transcription factor 67 isoform X2 n=1 Tax=Brassica campestris TaxID=3711 RepID=UPI00142D2C93|nr:probable WRKY transcription factor 67 isoform X2 [Brassica rapa]
MFHGADRAVEALLRGQESANLLKTVLEHQRTSSVSIEPLFDTVLDSFSYALSLFASSNPQPLCESSQNKPTPVVARKSPKKNSHGEEGLEQYNHDSPTPICNDGFSWMKYGQKKIKTSSHQRCYYRCAYAKDRNCNATKRVQQIQDSPSVYRTTYVGKHMCEVNAFLQPNEDIVNGSKMIRFDKTDQGMPEPVMPQLVPVEQEALIIEGTDQIMNLECGSNEFLVDDDQLWEYQFPPCSPGDFMFLDDLSEFDYNPFHV